jgi:hypothetical protein
MEPFECSGVWWVAGESSDRVAGVLRFSHEEGLVLSLLGTLSGREESVGAKSQAIILGMVLDCPLGQTVTLTECVQTSYRMISAGLSSEGYRAERAYFGRHLTNPEDFLFSKCQVQTSGLSGWAAHLTGFQVEHVGKVSEGGAQLHLKYVPPKPLKAEISAGELTLVVAAGSQATLRERSFKEIVTIRIKSAETLGEDAWTSRYVYPLMNLLTLATGTPNALTRLDLSGAEEPFGSVRVVAQRIFKGRGEDQSAPGMDSLLPLQGHEDGFPALIPRWFEVAAAFQDTCNIFFGLWYAPGAYIDMRLLGIGQALQLYQAKRIGVGPPALVEVPPELLTALPPKSRELLLNWAGDIKVDTFRPTIKRLAEEHRTTLGTLAPLGLEALIDAIVKVRNHVLYRESFPVPPERYSQMLFLATETLSCLMKSCFLAELRFTPEERQSLFARNPMHDYLRHEWSNWAGQPVSNLP